VHKKGEVDLNEVPDEYIKAFGGIFESKAYEELHKSTVDKIKNLPDIRRGVGVKAAP
jgi:hypothetical protein